MNKINKLKRKISIFIINHFLSTTHFFGLKRVLLNFGGIKVGYNSKVVGPFFCGTEIEIEIGEDCWIGRNFKIEGNGNVKIENNCDFGPSVMIITGSHEIGVKNRRAGIGISFSIKIEKGCWIGARSTIIGNITISKMTVIGSMSLVNRDIEENVVAVGIPCKSIKKL